MEFGFLKPSHICQWFISSKYQIGYLQISRHFIIIYLIVASQQDRENSDKKKKRQKSTISLNQLKYVQCITLQYSIHTIYATSFHTGHYIVYIISLSLSYRSLAWPHSNSSVVDYNEDQYEVARYVFLKVVIYNICGIHVCMYILIMYVSSCVCMYIRMYIYKYEYAYIYI